MEFTNNEFRSAMYRKMDHIQTLMLQIMTPIIQAVGLNNQSAILLLLIQQEECCSISHLQKKLGMNQGNLSSLCKKLEQQGFVLRERKKEDERIVLVRLSEQGNAILKQMCEMNSPMEERFREIPQAQKQNVLDGMESLEKMLEMIYEGGQTHA